MKLYVPVTLRGLLIGRAPDSNCFADISNDFSRLPFSAAGEYVPSQLAAHRDMKKGVHLHWSLPDALTRGEMNPETDDVEYPPIPDRWLLTRLWSEDGGTVKTMSFLIESDAVSAKRSASLGNLNSPTIPDETNPGGFLYLGRGYRCGSTMPATSRLANPLTAVLPGNPLYTAFYPDCRNVLGFYDDMTDEDGNIIQSAKLSYTVAGWFSRPDADPVAAAARGKQHRTIETLSWHLLDSAPEDNFDGIICHAMLCAVNWNGPDARYDLNIPQANLSVGVGNNSSEALSAILSGYLKNTDNASATETMLTHMLSGRPGEILSHDGIAKSEAALYEARFSSESQIRSYSLKWDDETSGGTLADDERRAVPSPSPALASLLKAYNRALETQVARRMEIEYLQENLFDFWFMWKRGKIEERAFTEKLHDLGTQIAVKKHTAAQLQAILEVFDVPDGPFDANLEEAARSEGFILAPGTAGRFWTPNPPVLLIANTNVNKAHGADGQYSGEGLLNVRKSLISKLTVSGDISGADREYTLAANEIIPGMPEAESYLAEAYALACETALLSHSFSALLAKRLTGSGADGQREAKLTAAITGLQTIFIAASAVIGDSGILEDTNSICGFDGPFPEKTAVEYHKQPWHPLYMDWKADYYPDSCVIDETPSIKNWRLLGLDMMFAEDTGKSMKLVDAIAVSGRTFLTPHAGRSLSSRLGELEADIPNADAISVLSQTIPELHEQLMMRSLQMMPTVFIGERKDIRSDLEKALEGYKPMFPMFNSMFSPVRAGFLRLRCISLIDSFGQLLEAEPSLVSASESMRRGEEVSTSEIMLPPRLLQPSRINFDLHSDVCGWILPNFFDNNITLYSTEGICLGTLQQVTEAEKKVLKLKLPPEMGGRAVDTYEHLHDSDLRAFADRLVAIGSEAFAGLMRSIDSALASTNPCAAAQFNSLSFMLGRPLALVRAGLSIETLGPRRQYRCYAGTKPPHPDVDVSRLAVDLRLGFRRRHGDGLFGYYNENNFDAIHFTGHTTEKGNSYILRGRKECSLPIKPDAKPVSLVLLMDPTADVHVTSGILPVKAVRMDPVYVQEALRRLYHIIFIAPVIQDTETLSLPVFPVEGKRWAWYGIDVNAKDETDTEPQKSSTEAVFDGTGAVLREGWITFKEAENTSGG